jgi:hypothetical protein
MRKAIIAVGLMLAGGVCVPAGTTGAGADAAGCVRPTGVQRIVFSAREYPNVRRHFRGALRRGWPRRRVVNRRGADFDEAGERCFHVKKLGRFEAPGHALTADRTRRSRGAGSEYVHSIVDDCSRLAYSDIHPDETAATVTAFTRPPRTNGKVERFNQTLQREWAYALGYASSDARRQALPHWIDHYKRASHPLSARQPPAPSSRSGRHRARQLAQALEQHDRLPAIRERLVGLEARVALAHQPVHEDERKMGQLPLVLPPSR